MNKIVNLSDTIEMMNSSDYKERFKAEYYQLKIRYNKLADMCIKWDAGKLDFTPTCFREIYDYQLSVMEDYLRILLERARTENIELEDVD